VRIFTDHRINQVPPGDFDSACDLEWAAGCQDPYRRLARLIHFLGRRTP